MRQADVQRDPFLLIEDFGGDGDVNPAGDGDGGHLARRNKEKEARRQLLEAAVDSLALKSVLMGVTPLANLNDRIVRVGETVTVRVNRSRPGEPSQEISLRVTAIGSGSATLITEDAEFDLVVEREIMLSRN